MSDLFLLFYGAGCFIGGGLVMRTWVSKPTTDWERIIAGHQKVEEAWQGSREASLAVDEARRKVDERIAAVLEMIALRLDRIEAAISNGDDNE